MARKARKKSVAKKKPAATANKKRKVAAKKKSKVAARKKVARAAQPKSKSPSKPKGVIAQIAGAAEAVLDTLTDAERLHHKMEPHVSREPE